MKIKAWVELRGNAGKSGFKEWVIEVDDDELMDGDIDEIVADEMQYYMSYGWERVNDGENGS